MLALPHVGSDLLEVQVSLPLFYFCLKFLLKVLFSPGQSCKACWSTKRKCTTMEEGSRKGGQRMWKVEKAQEETQPPLVLLKEPAKEGERLRKEVEF